MFFCNLGHLCIVERNLLSKSIIPSIILLAFLNFFLQIVLEMHFLINT